MTHDRQVSPHPREQKARGIIGRVRRAGFRDEDSGKSDEESLNVQACDWDTDHHPLRNRLLAGSFVENCPDQTWRLDGYLKPITRGILDPRPFPLDRTMVKVGTLTVQLVGG